MYGQMDTMIGESMPQQGPRRSRPFAGALALPFALLLALAPLLMAAPADAAELGFTARPLPGSPNAQLGFFKLDAKAGATVEREVVLTNLTNKAKVIDLTPCDGAAAVYGGVAYTDNETKPAAVGSWIRLARSEVTLPPGESVRVPLVVSVPSTVTTGVHMGGISIWEPAAATTSGSAEAGGDEATTRITMVTRMVLTVMVTTPGPAVPDLTINGVKAEARPDGMHLLVGIANEGTAPTSGEGTISLAQGGYREKIALGDMVPGSSTDYPVAWKTDPAQGAYQAQVEIRYADDKKVATWSGTFTVGGAEKKQLKDRLVVGAKSGLPWELIGWAVLGTLGAGILLLAGILLGRPRQRSA